MSTLKKVPVDRLRLGVYLHELCGPWLHHPFWRKKFLLVDPKDLALLKASEVRECIIDTSKGVDVELAVAEPAPLPAEPAAAVAAEPVAEKPKLVPRVTIEDEAHRAEAICAKTRLVVEGLHNDIRLGKVIETDACLSIVDEVAKSVDRNASALVSLARLKSHDTYSYMHSVAVCALMVTLARQLGHDEDSCREAGFAGMLHDIGKATMPLSVLNKPGELTPAEFELMKTHPERGRELLKKGGVLSEAAIDVCAHHHERPDGRGYPYRLAGDQLSELARMGAVCDVYDAITSNRPYKAGWDPAESLSKMAIWADEGQFDKRIFRAFVDSIGIFPIGSLVRLQSGRLAVVIDQDAANPMAPRVKAFFSTKANMLLLPEIIELAKSSDRIVARESNSKWKFKQLDELSTGHIQAKASAREPSKLHERV